MSLKAKRCFNHSVREAVAKCLDCGNFFCRECITEHNTKLVCCNCLGKTTQEAKAGNTLLSTLTMVGLSVLGLIVLWMFFLFIATRLLNVESDSFEQSLHKHAPKYLAGIGSGNVEIR